MASIITVDRGLRTAAHPIAAPSSVNHNVDRLVEVCAGHDTGLDPMPKPGFEATIRMFVERPAQRADHVPQQLVFGDQFAPQKPCPFSWWSGPIPVRSR